MIYFVQEKGLFRNRVKIGFTEKDASERLRNLQGQCPSVLKLLFVVPGSKQDESNYHDMFAFYRLHGEWFRYGLRLKLFIWLNRFMLGNLFKPSVNVKSLPQLPKSTLRLLSNGLLELILEKLIGKYPETDLLQYMPDYPDKFDMTCEEHDKIIKRMKSQRVRDWMRQIIWSPSGPIIIDEDEFDSLALPSGPQIIFDEEEV